MPDRASVFEGIQLGVESLAAPGTQVAAIKRLDAVSLEVMPKFTQKKFRPNGFKYNTLVIPGKDYSDGKITGQLDYNNIVYLLASVVGQPSIATHTGGTLSKDWTFTTSSTSPDNLQTYTVDMGSWVRGERVTGLQVTELGITFKREEATPSGQVIGQQFQDGVYITGNAVQTLTETGGPTGGTFTLTFGAQTTSAIAYNATASAIQIALQALSSIGAGNIVCSGGPINIAPVVCTFVGSLGNSAQALMTANSSGLTPSGTVTPSSTQAGQAVTEITALPVIPGNVNISLDTTPGALGTSILQRVLQVDLKVSKRADAFWPIGSAFASYGGTIEMPADLTVKIQMEADAAGMANLPLLRAGTTQFMRIKVAGPIIEGAIPYVFQWDMAVKLDQPSAYAAQQGLQTIDWDFDGVHDPVWGQAQKVVVTNQLTGL